MKSTSAPSLRARRTVPVAACLAIASAVAGCSNGPGITDPADPVWPPVAPTPSGAVASGASTNFGLDLFMRVVEGESRPNVLVSPLSASMALGMTLNGAAGDTWEAMRTTLGFTALSEDDVNAAYRNLIDHLRGLDPDVQFGLANSLWYEETYPVKQPFRDAAETWFDAAVRGLDFTAPTAPAVISGWAEDATGGRIQDLITEIDPLERLFLVNAVYFRAPWALPFEVSGTRDGDFTALSGAVVSTPLMHLDGTIRSYQDTEVQAVELLYADSAFSMVVVGPATGAGLEAVRAALTPGRLAAIVSGMTPGRIDLTLPKFRFDYDIRLDPALKAMGMAIAFEPGAADFSRISDVGQPYITRVKQKAFIDVHELGTEAAAATAVGVGITSAPPRMVFDRPFYLLIRERGSGSVLFVGRVGDPTIG